MTIKQWLYHFIVITILLAEQTSYAQPVNNNTQPFVVSGVIINNDNTHLIERFTNYLAEQSGYPLRVMYVNQYSELSRVLHDNPKAVGWTCGAPYVQDRVSAGQQLVAVPLLHNKPSYYSLILARKNRTEKTLIDFEGEVLAYSDPRSNSGYLSPKFALHQQGIDIEKHFRLLIDTGNHEGSINALLHGLADVAAVDEYVWESYLKLHPETADQLHELERMGPYPFTPIVSGSKVSKNDLNKLSDALTKMNANDEGKEILSAFHLNGFIEKKPAFYQPIKNMLDQVQLDEGR